MASVSDRHAPRSRLSILPRKTTISRERERGGGKEERLALLTRRIDESKLRKFGGCPKRIVAGIAVTRSSRVREKEREQKSERTRGCSLIRIALDHREGLCATAKDVISEIFVPNFHRSIFKERACESGFYLLRFEYLQQPNDNLRAAMVFLGASFIDIEFKVHRNFIFNTTVS